MSSEGDSGSFTEGAAVRVRGEDGDFLDATIVRQHRNGDYTVKYEETGKVEKYVPKDRIHSADKKRKSSKQDKDGSGEDDNVPELEVNAVVQFKNEKGEWCDGEIRRIRSNGRYDVALEGEDEVVKNVERRDIRERNKSPRKSKKKKSEDDTEDDSEDERVIRRRKSRARRGRSKRELVTSDDDSDDGIGRARRNIGAGFSQLRVNQLVQFEDKSGRIRRGELNR